MKSGKKFKKIGRPTLLEQKLGARPAHLSPAESHAALALAQSLQSYTPGHQEWMAEVKSNAVGVGLTNGRRKGGIATSQRGQALREYITRNYGDLFVIKNCSHIATRILRAESNRGEDCWTDSGWNNGADTGKSKYIPKHSSLRKLLPKLIFGKG
jgi:hypothetical protein